MRTDSHTMICLPEQVSDAGSRQDACRAFLFALACSCCLFFPMFSIHAQDVLPQERQKSLEELLQEPPRECLPVREIPPEDCAFDEGERLEFSVRYVWGILDSEVGKASATVAEAEGGSGVPLYHCIAEGRTSRFFDMFFKVRERFESWFRQSDMRPLVSSRDTYEGGYEARNNYRWIRPGEQIEADVYTTRLGDTSMVLPGTECTFDLVSLFYFARNLDFSNYEENVKYPISFAIDDGIYNLYFIILGRETIRIRGVGKFRTIKFAARMVAGEVFNGDTDMYIWVTDDKNKVPVYFESPIKVGSVSGRITGFSGLKHPLDSKID